MPGGTTVSVQWRGRSLATHVPHPLAGHPIDLPERLVREAERAAAAVRLADQRTHLRYEGLGRLLLQAEGVASSSFEGVRAPAALVAMAEVAPGAADQSAGWVADNLAVVDLALDHARSPRALAIPDLLDWHRRLMAHAPPPVAGAGPGEVRSLQNWVGSLGPREAAYVPPPPDRVPGLVEDLVAAANEQGWDPVTQAAAVHAQFESIHPFGDGNGRLGRILIGWVLVRRLGVAVPPPVSLAVGRDPGGYLSGLVRWRGGDAGAMVGWLAGAVRRSSEQVATTLDEVEAIQVSWRQRLADVRADATAHRLTDVLPAHLVVNVALVAALLGVSQPVARGAIAALAERGILSPLDLHNRDLHTRGRGRPARWWGAGEVLAIAAGWG